MARRVRYHELGGPEVLRLESFDPGEPGPGEVRIAVGAIGLNWADTLLRSGNYLISPALPAPIGGEGAGTVVAVGPGAGEWQVGDRAAVLIPTSFDRYGTYASEALFPVSGLIRMADGMSLEQGAASWIAFLTAWGGLIQQGGLTAGDTVLITAASSSVGLAALQIAADLGAVPIATTRGTAKIGALHDAGAAHVIDTNETGILEAVANLTGGAGVRVIFDAIAGALVTQLAACLTERGTLVIYGGLSQEPTPFPRQPAMAGNLTMRGFSLGRMLDDPQSVAQACAGLEAKLVDGSFSMPIAQRFALDDIVEAHRAMQRAAHVGKIIVTV